MKLMMEKWCWIGLVLCVSGSAWAAKAHEDDEKPAAGTKKSSKADDETAKDDAKGDDTKDDATTDEEEETPSKPEAKKESAEAEVSASSNGGGGVAINLAAMLGYGTSAFTHLGFGFRGGITLGGKEGLYLGLAGTLFTGSSVSETRINNTAERSLKTTIIGADVGYDFPASDDILLRPYMSVGAALNSDHSCATGVCSDDNGAHLTVSPGAQFMYLLGGGFWAGADMRYQIVMSSSDATALITSLALGLRF